MSLHDDELTIELPLVRRLVDRAAPDLAGLPLRALRASGSSNALFLLGTDLLLRLPRQPGGSASIAKEARWVPYLASGLPVRVPEVMQVCEPDLGYPESWSIVRWIDGTAPAVPTGGSAGQRLARDLAGLVAAMRRLPVPPDAHVDPALRWNRGEPLAALDASTREYLARCGEVRGLDLDLDACLRVWEAAMTLPATAGVNDVCWLHGDLLAENLLVSDGRLTAVLDFGALTVGDPTVDLVAAWEVLDRSGRALFRSVLDVDEVTWLRGRAWALAIAVMTFPYYWHTMPERCAARLVMARAILDDAAS